jgi:hypothetical protein
MFMNFRDSIWKIKFLMIDRMIVGDVNQLQFRKYFFQFQSDEFIHSVVIIYMEKTTRLQIFPKIAGIFCCEGAAATLPPQLGGGMGAFAEGAPAPTAAPPGQQPEATVDMHQ